MVANFSRFKDHPTFLRAAQHILATRRDVVFVMVGGGETMDACRRTVMPANQDGLLFAGDRADVESIVNVFDVGALATFTEGIPNAIMEYMALGKPVVASGGGGIPELMVDGETGFLTEAGDASGFAARIGWLLGDETRRRTMGEAGRDRIAREFSLERMTEAHRGLYDELVARASAPR
jgi:glycosyltransferase involved in cell wall biosynthesis